MFQTPTRHRGGVVVFARVRSGRVLPIAVMALAIVAFLVLVSYAITPNQRWPWSAIHAPASTVANTKVACTLEAKICPDGSTVGRSGPNCAFADCPSPAANANLGSTNTSSDASATATVLYYTTKTTTESGDRNWPTIELFRQTESTGATSVATLGKVGEYPSNFRLSPNDRYLAVSLEQSAAVLDLVTGQLHRVMTAKYFVSGLVFSPDSKKLFVWDQGQDTGDNSYTAHSIDLATYADHEVARGSLDLSFSPAAWRADGLVVMMRYYYPIGTVYTFDPTSGRTKQVDDTTSIAHLVAADGKYYSLVDSVNTPCNEYSGSAFSRYHVKSVANGKEVGTFGDGTRENVMLTYSPDDTEVLWSSTPIPTDHAQCANQTKQYYRQKIVGGQPIEVADPVALLRTWQAQTLLVTYPQPADPNTGIVTPYINNQDWSLPPGASIVASYFAAPKSSGS